MCTDAELRPNDAILVEFAQKAAGPHALAEAFGRLKIELSLQTGSLEVCRAEAEPWITAYLRGSRGRSSVDAAAALVRERLARLADGPIEVSRLVGIRLYEGASPLETPQYRYVVRTNVQPGGEEELERWYDEEHMPALAAVSGVVLAQRMVSLDAAPRYFAYYDLATPDVLKSQAWLDVRATDWSGRVRPTFRDTRRVVSRRLFELGL